MVLLMAMVREEDRAYFFFLLLFILVEIHVRGHTSRFSHERQFKLNFLILHLYGESKQT